MKKYFILFKQFIKLKAKNMKAKDMMYHKNYPQDKFKIIF